jgi:hypothetical protein
VLFDCGCVFENLLSKGGLSHAAGTHDGQHLDVMIGTGDQQLGKLACILLDLLPNNITT